MTIIGLLTNKLVAVNLGPGGIVILGQLKSAMNLIMQLGIAGSNNLVVRLFTKKYSRHYLFRTILIISIIINIIFISLGFVYIDKLTLFLTGSIDLTDSMYWLILGIPAISLLSLNTAIINGQAKQVLFSVLVLSYSFVFLLMLALSVTITLDIMVIEFVLSLVISSAAITFWNRRYFLISLRKTFKIRLVKKVLIYGLTLIFPFLVNTLVLIYLRTVMMEKDITGAGLWQAVWQISDNLASIVYLYVISVLLPKALHKKAPMETFRYLLKTYQMPLVLFISGGIIFIVFSKQILSLLYDQSFMLAEPLIIYQLVGDFFKIIGWIFLLTIASYGLLKLSIMIEVVNLVTSLLLIHYFVENYSTIGASYAYMFKYIFYVLLMGIAFYIYSKQKIKDV
ncbi:hypothetical protein [Sulfurimonas sp.]|uniref:hypothetical protein n=1 Tax=Sulfurimonas sp. TaxID=2022749 RepID=UPI0019F60566|nr:hypothetical protein [Sulfurimonas sp.]MBE0515330.1 hypothetical protein [Sulfurimonas sp.]